MSAPKLKPIPLSHPNPRLIIVGAGVGGLALANLCEAAGFDYLVLEKASDFKPLGSAILLAHATFPFLDQLGIFEDLKALGKPVSDTAINTLNLRTGNIKRNGCIPHYTNTEQVRKYGYPALMFARPDIMEVLLKKIPKTKILMKKRILNIQQNKEGVMVRVADGTSYHGHILVGADGCYSPVRQSMFEEVEKHRPLPASDKAPLKYDIDCIVGVTRPLDPLEYPEMATEKSDFEILLPKHEKVSIWLMPLSRNRLGWMVNEVISDQKISIPQGSFQTPNGENENNFAQTEWGPEAAEAMCNRFAHYPTPYGNNATLQTFMDQTPKELISKVMLEEKFFETWQHGRTCLIGDACHKVLPFGAAGATNAMLDALQLVNLLYDLKSSSYESIREMLIQYENLRKEYGRTAVKGSAVGGKLFHAKGWTGDLARYLVLHAIPDSILDRGKDKVANYRPQCAFLDFKPLGVVKHDKQDYCARYLMEKEQSEGIRKFDEEELISIDILEAIDRTVTL